MPLEIEIVRPEETNYEELEEFITGPSNHFDYAEFARQYNGQPPEAIFAFQYTGKMMSNFTKILAGRGLVADMDYQVKGTAAQQNRTNVNSFQVVLKKLTTKECKIK